MTVGQIRSSFWVVRGPAAYAPGVSSSRILRWVSSILYGAVLVSGLYYDLVHLGPSRPLPPVAGFLGGMAALFALDLVEGRRYPVRTPPGPAVVLLCLRLSLVITVAALDGSGLSRILLVLVPFTAYFAFGRKVSVALAVACVAVVVTGYSLTAPRWYVEAAYVSDLLMFCAGLVLTVTMAAVAVGERESRTRLEQANARLSAYAAQVAELSATAERVRVARDIHDGLGHHLTAISVLLEKASAFSSRDPAVAGQALTDARASTRRALDDVRRSVRALRTPEQEPFSLTAALTELVRDADSGSPAIGLEVTGDETACDMPARAALYRAAQEGLTNARRHARAGQVWVRLTFDGPEAKLVVSDDGRGVDGRREGFGLTGMRERVQLLGGDVSLVSEPGAGTRLTVTIPGTTRVASSHGHALQATP
ncbi:sensor histidine kinase [Sphaerisporangium flaviroseum]|uniref:sensor histidine kinase n=1 Tax=Sphaerisporangium flaviroseum TaxID=509199 RepID=UPI0031EF8E33